MKNYIITSCEYEICSKRLNRLYEKREKLQTMITKTTSNLKDVLVDGGHENDKMSIYVAELDEIEREINELEKEISNLKDDLDYMDKRLSNIEDLKEQIFVMHFIKGMKVKEIAPKVYCDISTVYKKIKEINKERELAKNSQKYSGIMVS